MKPIVITALMPLEELNIGNIFHLNDTLYFVALDDKKVIELKNNGHYQGIIINSLHKELIGTSILIDKKKEVRKVAIFNLDPTNIEVVSESKNKEFNKTEDQKLLERYTGLAMQGLCADPSVVDLSKLAISIAKETIKELKKEQL